MNREETIEWVRGILAAAFDSEAVMKELNVTQDNIDTLREMALSSDNIPKATPDKIFLLSLCACDKRMDMSLNIMNNYYKIMHESPQFFHNRVIMSAEVQQAFDNQYNIILPHIPGKNFNLIYHGISNSDPEIYFFDEAEKAFLMTVETCVYQNGPRNGLAFLFDMKGSKIAHLFKPKLKSLRQIFRLVEYGCPFRIQWVHVINAAPFLDAVLALIKPLMKTDLLKRVHFHSANMDYEKFYEVIPKSCLPSDFGGDLESLDELRDKQRKSIICMQDYFTFQEKLQNFEYEDMDFDGTR